MDIIKKLIQEFGLKRYQAENTIRLIDEGNTIPFIARYRKEQTGELSDVVLREFSQRLSYLRNLESRKEEVIRLISEQGKLTDELKRKIIEADVLQRVEDLYRPFRPKRRTRATIAKEKGLEPLADIILSQKIEDISLEELAKQFINEEKGVNSIEDAYNGAKDIIAEIISDNAEFRRFIRNITFNKGILVSKAVDSKVESVYEMYYDYKEPVKKIPNHRILAINRGEKEKYLRVGIDVPYDEIITYLLDNVIEY